MLNLSICQCENHFHHYAEYMAYSFIVFIMNTDEFVFIYLFNFFYLNDIITMHPSEK